MVSTLEDFKLNLAEAPSQLFTEFSCGLQQGDVIAITAKDLESSD